MPNRPLAVSAPTLGEAFPFSQNGDRGPIALGQNLAATIKPAHYPPADAAIRLNYSCKFAQNPPSAFTKRTGCGARQLCTLHPRFETKHFSGSHSMRQLTHLGSPREAQAFFSPIRAYPTCHALKIE